MRQMEQECRLSGAIGRKDAGRTELVTCTRIVCPVVPRGMSEAVDTEITGFRGDLWKAWLMEIVRSRYECY